MKAFYFPEPKKELFGALHEPRRASPGGRGVVLCYPFGHEYVQFHRAFRRLAEQLAEQGLATLRFDFYGSGDSAGTSEEATVRRWVSDVRGAVAELKARARCTEVALVGYRLGATLAAMATQGEQRLRDVVLWDPVLNGGEYLEELRRAHTKKLETVGSVGEVSHYGDAEELLGYPCGPELVSQLEAIESDVFLSTTATNILLVDTLDSEALQSVGKDLRARGIRCDYESNSGPRLWTEDINRVVVPLPIIRKIGDWLVRRDRHVPPGA